MQTISYLHSGDLGDIIYSLPAVRTLGAGHYYLCNRDFTKELTRERYEAMAALLLEQPYILGVSEHKGQKVTHDFTGFRKFYVRKPGTNLATIQAHYLNASLAIDTRTPWLKVHNPIQHGRAVFARSLRYHNKDWTSYIWPQALDRYPDAIFIGLEEDHEAFERAFGRVQFERTLDLYHCARLIAGSSIFIGNQSAPYAVAEGLKVNSIQETHETVRDVLFPRPNGYFVTDRRQWEKLYRKEDKPFAVLLQFYHGDFEEAKLWAHYVADLEATFRDDIEILIAHRFDTPPSKAIELKTILEEKFASVGVISCHRQSQGWPTAANDMWAEAMTQIADMRSKGLLQSEWVATLEPDALPISRSWLNLLRKASQVAAACRKHCTGFASDHHVNGNLIIRVDALDNFMHLRKSSTKQPWDVIHGKFLLSINLPTTAIWQERRVPPGELTRERVQAVMARPGIAVWHGVKGVENMRLLIETVHHHETPDRPEHRAAQIPSAPPVPGADPLREVQQTSGRDPELRVDEEVPGPSELPRGAV